MVRKLMILFLALTVLLGPLLVSGAGVSGDVRIVSDDESPVQVSLSLSKYPGIGQETTATCTVVGAWNMRNVVAEIELPEGATLVKGDLKWTGALKANQPVSFAAIIAFHQTGNWGVRATALAVVDEDTSWSDVAYVYLNVDRDLGTKGLKALGGDPRRVQVEEPEDGVAPKLEEQLDVELNSEGVAPEQPDRYPVVMKEAGEGPVSVLPQGNLIVKGAWKYYKRHAISSSPLTHMLVQLVRGDNNNHLAFAYTDGSGNFTFPAISNPGQAGIKVRVFTWQKWGAPNYYAVMMVVPGGSDWPDTYYAETNRYVFSDGTRSVGTWTIARPLLDPNSKAWWGQVDLYQGFMYPPNQPGGAIAEWSPTYNPSVCPNNSCFAHPGNHHIHLLGSDLDDTSHVILHEYGHNIMYNVYHEYFPYNDCGGDHYIPNLSGPRCAWFEGWATFFALAVTNDTSRRWPGIASVNLEKPTWFYTGKDTAYYDVTWDDGDRVEGRVIGALLDIKDSANDGYDQYSDGFNNIWATVYNQTDDTFSQFWSAWQSRGYNQRTFRAAAFQNTIDYDYKPKLTLTWGATPPDLDLHMWLPSSNRYHVYYSAKGSLTAFPWANLDVDDTSGYGPENITIAKPYNGTYVVAVDRYSTSGNIAGTGARLKYYLGPYLVTSWTVPSSGTGRWWYVADINGYTGSYTTRNTIRTSGPGPYAISPAGLNGDEKPK